MRKARVLLVDDHPIVSLGVRTLLEGAENFEWIGSEKTASDALEAARRLQPDLIVQDLMLAGRDGLGLIPQLLEAAPSARIVAFSALDERSHARRALGAGASGYVSKDAGFPELLNALRSIAAGEPYASESVKQAMLREAIGSPNAGRPGVAERLSNQELCVLHLIGSGLGTTEVAAKLGVSAKTVSTYRERIKNKLGLKNARELERRAEAFFRLGALSS